MFDGCQWHYALGENRQATVKEDWTLSSFKTENQIVELRSINSDVKWTLDACVSCQNKNLQIDISVTECTGCGTTLCVRISVFTHMCHVMCTGIGWLVHGRDVISLYLPRFELTCPQWPIDASFMTVQTGQPLTLSSPTMPSQCRECEVALSFLRGPGPSL